MHSAGLPTKGFKAGRSAIQTKDLKQFVFKHSCGRFAVVRHPNCPARTSVVNLRAGRLTGSSSPDSAQIGGSSNSRTMISTVSALRRVDTRTGSLLVA